MGKCIRVMIVDDHTLFRQGLRKVMEADGNIQVVGECGNGNEALTLVDEVYPDLVLMDIKMPEMDGIECIKLMRKDYPNVKILALSMYNDTGCVLKAIKAGVKGYVQKDASADSLIDTIRKVHTGNTSMVHLAVTTDIVHGLVHLPSSSDKESLLTEQEEHIVKLMAEGNSNKRIASELFISDQTVKGHIHNILRKLQASDRTQAVAEALRQGIVT